MLQEPRRRISAAISGRDRPLTGSSTRIGFERAHMSPLAESPSRWSRSGPSSRGNSSCERGPKNPSSPWSIATQVKTERRCHVLLCGCFICSAKNKRGGIVIFQHEERWLDFDSGVVFWGWESHFGIRGRGPFSSVTRRDSLG